MRDAGCRQGPAEAAGNVPALLLIHVAQEEDVVMRTYDLSPFWRSSVGFDRLFDLVNDTVNDSDNYPLYDIARIGEGTSTRFHWRWPASARTRSPSPRSNRRSPSRAARRTRVITTTCIRESQCGRSVASSTWRTMSR